MGVVDGDNPTGGSYPPSQWRQPPQWDGNGVASPLAKSIGRGGVELSHPPRPNFSWGSPLRGILFPGRGPDFARGPPLGGVE